MVALGAGRHDRNSYKLWEEGRPPDFALEALSQRTWQKDVQIKPGLYHDLGVREFWQLDPLRKLPEPMIGYRLDAGVYKPIPVEQSGGRRSEVLGAELFFDGTELRIRSLRTGKDVPHLPQAMQRLDQSERQREEERARRQIGRAPTGRGARRPANGRAPTRRGARTPGKRPSANAKRNAPAGKRPSANATKPSNGSPNWRPSCGARSLRRGSFAVSETSTHPSGWAATARSR